MNESGHSAQDEFGRNAKKSFISKDTAFQDDTVCILSKPVQCV